jgi:hypothetical protein
MRTFFARTLTSIMLVKQVYCEYLFYGEYHCECDMYKVCDGLNRTCDSAMGSTDHAKTAGAYFRDS